VLYQLSYWPREKGATEVAPACLLGLAVPGMFAAAWAKLAQLHALGVVTPIFLGGVVALLAVVALQGDDRTDVFLFRSHANLPTFRFIR
jgi:hypothetical protein